MLNSYCYHWYKFLSINWNEYFTNCTSGLSAEAVLFLCNTSLARLVFERESTDLPTAVDWFEPLSAIHRLKEGWLDIFQINFGTKIHNWKSNSNRPNCGNCGFWAAETPSWLSSIKNLGGRNITGAGRRCKREEKIFKY